MQLQMCQSCGDMCDMDTMVWTDDDTAYCQKPRCVERSEVAFAETLQRESTPTPEPTPIRDWERCSCGGVLVATEPDQEMCSGCGNVYDNIPFGD